MIGLRDGMYSVSMYSNVGTLDLTLSSMIVDFVSLCVCV